MGRGLSHDHPVAAVEAIDQRRRRCQRLGAGGLEQARQVAALQPQLALAVARGRPDEPGTDAGPSDGGDTAVHRTHGSAPAPRCNRVDAGVGGIRAARARTERLVRQPHHGQGRGLRDRMLRRPFIRDPLSADALGVIAVCAAERGTGRAGALALLSAFGRGADRSRERSLDRRRMWDVSTPIATTIACGRRPRSTRNVRCGDEPGEHGQRGQGGSALPARPRGLVPRASMPTRMWSPSLPVRCTRRHQAGRGPAASVPSPPGSVLLTGSRPSASSREPAAALSRLLDDFARQVHRVRLPARRRTPAGTCP